MANPSLGLGVWGALTPASDCYTCRNICITLQVGAGLALMTRPGHNPMRGKWANRGIRLAGVLSGSYLILMAGVEAARYFLRTDPWYNDAVAARKKSPSQSLLEDWFGPKDHTPLSFEEFLARAKSKKTGQGARGTVSMGSSPVKEAKMAQVLRLSNRNTMEKILDQMRKNTFNPPISPNEMGFFDQFLEDADSIEYQLETGELDLWGKAADMLPMNMVVIPNSGLRV